MESPQAHSSTEKRTLTGKKQLLQCSVIDIIIEKIRFGKVTIARPICLLKK